MNDAQTFFDRAVFSKTCWRWPGAKSSGYGKVWFGGRSLYAHRLAYELERGPIPDGMQIDHLCRIRDCINPRHLEAVTPGENIRRGMSPGAISLRRDTCLHGHSMDDARPGSGKAGRKCRTCEKVRYQAQKEKRHA